MLERKHIKQVLPKPTLARIPTIGAAKERFEVLIFFLFFLSLKKKKVNKLNCQQCGRAGEQGGHNQATLWKQKWVTEGICDCEIQTMLKEIKLTTITGLGRGLWRYHGHAMGGSAYPGQQSQTAASC